jgi:hypothetical protein
MKKTLTLMIFLLALLLTAVNSHAGTISLAAAMDPMGFLSETAGTGSFARINLGGGGPGDGDGMYDIRDGVDHPNPTHWGSDVDIFPREADFLVGSLEHAPINGTGVETVAITSIDLGEFWTAGSTDNSDISDEALGLWFMNTPNSAVTFGALDANDTVTFTDGVLTAINLEIDTSFQVDDTFGNLIVFNGTFSITGDELSYQINDTQTNPYIGPTTFTADLTGTVAAVGSYTVPNAVAVPAAAWPVWLFVSGLIGLTGIARLRKKKTTGSQHLTDL